MDKIALRPCPFCGQIPEINKLPAMTFPQYYQLDYKIQCKNCGVFFVEESVVKFSDNGQVILEKDGYKDCIEKWNRRANNGQD